MGSNFGKKGWYMLVGIFVLILLAGWIFWSKGNDNSIDAELKSSYRSRIHEKGHPHLLLDRYSTLAHRSRRSHTFTTLIDISIPQFVTYTGIQATLPPLTGQLQIEGDVTYGSGQGSGTMILGGKFIALSGSNQYQFHSELHIIRSGQTTWIQLESLQYTFSGSTDTGLFVWWSYLKTYEHSRIRLMSGENLFPDLLAARTFDTLTEQPNQHIIPTLSGELQLLVKGNKLALDGTIDPENHATIQLKFPLVGLTLTAVEQKKGIFTSELSHYLVKNPLFVGSIQFTRGRNQLQANIVGKGSGNKNVSRELHSRHDIKKSVPKNLTLPAQSLERNKVMAVWR